MRPLPDGHGRWLLMIPLLLVGAGLLASPAPREPATEADQREAARDTLDHLDTAVTAAGDTLRSVDTSATPPVAAFSADRVAVGADDRASDSSAGATQVHLGREVAWVDGDPIAYSPASIFVLPGERVHIDVRPDPRRQRLVRVARPGSRGRSTPGDTAGVAGGAGDRGVPGELRPLDDDTWIWTAPDRPGTHRLEIRRGTTTEVQLRAFVMVPEGKLSAGRLNGYRIGRYPRVPLRGDTMYVRPEGFVEVTRANRDLRVSPRFRLKHFETKQGGGFPRYVVLQRKLLTKLELLVDALVKRGYPVSSLHVMSGYRTPSYNAGIGNVKYSRHVFGDASDVFVDEDGDGWMDDLNGDGRVSRADARVLYQIVDSLDRSLDTRRLLGGLGLYGPASHRGPFVHVDTRGSTARW